MGKIVLFSLLLAWSMLVVFQQVDCVPMTEGMDIKRQALKGKTEYITVHQQTTVTRRKRGATDHVDFPHTMDFSLKFSDKEISLTLKRNPFMTSDIRLSDENGPIEHGLGTNTGVYSNSRTLASFIVQCGDVAEHCTLRGSMAIDGNMWDIRHEGSNVHKAVQTPHDQILNFNTEPVSVSEMNLSSLPKADTPPLPEMSNLPNAGQPNDETKPRRCKRDIPTGCDIVECLAIVDESVWTFFLDYVDGDTTAAHTAIAVEFLALYTQADRHFDLISERRPDKCIRLYLTGVHIQKTAEESWSVPNELGPSETSNGPVHVDGEGGLFTCGQQGQVKRMESLSIDLTQCFTRKDIVRSSETTVRSLGYRFTCCNTDFANFSSEIIESYGDKVELLIAHEISHGLGADNDGGNGCNNDDSYIMADPATINADDLKLKNMYLFSACSLDEIYTHLDSMPSCLSDNGFTVDQYDSFANQSLAGTIFNTTYQCSVRFFVGSEPCDPSGQNRMFLPDMCDKGMFCTDEQGGCTNQNRPYDGTPCGDMGAFCLKGDCITGKDLGESCDCHSECTAPNSFCDITSGICKCDEGHYDDNGETEGGVCQTKVSVGQSCPQPDACLDPAAECRSADSTCICSTGYYESAGACALLKCIGETCTNNIQCKGSNTECSGNPKTCRCPNDRYLNVETGDCDSMTVEMVFQPAERIYKRVARSPGKKDGEKKEKEKESGKGKEKKKESKGKKDKFPFPSCVHQCLNATKFNNKPLGARCIPGQCNPEASVCTSTDDTCGCQEGYFDDNGAVLGGSCNEKIALDDACTQPDSCKDPVAYCSISCRCPSDYYNDNGACTRKKAVGESCTNSTECLGGGTECSGIPSTCRCRSGSFLDILSGNCALQGGIGAICEPGQCEPENCICDTVSNTCECQEGFFDSNGATPGGNCTAKLALDVACTEADSCLDPVAVCSGVCQCPSDYFNNNGVCVFKKRVGESCTNSTECQGVGVECFGSPSTCRCQDGSYLNISIGDCDMKKGLFEACEAGQCGAENSVCQPATGVCACGDGYVVNGTDCVKSCPSASWQRFNETCYLFGMLEVAYSEAVGYCTMFSTNIYSSNLVQVDTQEELTFLKDYMLNATFQPQTGYWNDLFQTTVNGNETWRTTGDVLVVSDWNGPDQDPGAAQQPDDLNGLQSCTTFFQAFSFRQADVECLNDVNGDSKDRVSAPLCEVNLDY